MNEISSRTNISLYVSLYNLFGRLNVRCILAKKKGIIVAFDFSRDCFNEIERIKKEDKIDTKLKTVREIFGLNYYGANSV